MGALMGGLGGAGELAGLKFGESCLRIGKYLKTIQTVTLSANIVNLGLALFDTASLVTSLFNPKSKFVIFTQKLHSSKLYNGAQLVIGCIGAFGGGMLKGINYDMANGISKCFIAGTLISTVSGLVAIENIKAGDMVLSTDVKTGETGYKKVVETYVRETMKLIHLKVNGEEIVTTEGHPFYVKDIGFVNASELSEGDKLTDSEGNVMFIESVSTEVADEAVRVYNFQVEDTHTYYVSDGCILVHNADGNYSASNGSEGSTVSESTLPGNEEYIGPLNDGDNHLIYGEGIGPRKKGVLGAHNKDNFYKTLKSTGYSLDDLLVGKPKKHPYIEGIYSQEYRIPSYDGRGNFIGYKDIPDPKTYFEPNVISNEQMIQWAEEAMQSGTQNGRIIDGVASNGLKFRGFIQPNGQKRYFPHF